jgi:hypothetical protein
MVANEKVRHKTAGDPVEKPKKLPAEFPEKFDTEQKPKGSPDDKKRGKGARFHGSM